MPAWFTSVVYSVLVEATLVVMVAVVWLAVTVYVFVFNEYPFGALSSLMVYVPALTWVETA